MCEPVTLAIIGSAVLGAGTAAYTADKQASATKKAADQATQNADKQAKAAEQEMNRQNAKGPNTAALQSENQQAAMAGPSGTMLTGPQGIDPSTLMLGKNTLLGQ